MKIRFKDRERWGLAPHKKAEGKKPTIMDGEAITASPGKALSDLRLDTREKQAILQAARILKEKFPVERVILFGSKARGDDEQGSDIDLFLLTSRPIHWKEREHIIGELFDVEIAFDVVISILDATVSEWNHGNFKYFPIRDSIYQEGIVAA